MDQFGEVTVPLGVKPLPPASVSVWRTRGEGLESGRAPLEVEGVSCVGRGKPKVDLALKGFLSK